MEPVSDEELQAYWLALGRFIASFADIEAMLFITAAEAYELPSYKLLAIGSSFRADGCMELIKRIIEFRKDSPEIKKHLKETLEQIAHINNARNMLLHNPTQYKPGGDFLTTNSLLARKSDQLRIFPVSANTLNDMTEDLTTAWMRLLYFQEKVDATKEFKPEGTEDFRQLFDDLLRRAWLYKPAQQSSKNQRSRTNAP